MAPPAQLSTTPKNKTENLRVGTRKSCKMQRRPRWEVSKHYLLLVQNSRKRWWELKRRDERTGRQESSSLQYWESWASMVPHNNLEWAPQKYFRAGAWEQGIPPREPPNGPGVWINSERIKLPLPKRTTVPNSKLVEGRTAFVSKGENLWVPKAPQEAGTPVSVLQERQSKYLHTGGFSQAAKITHKIPHSLSHSTRGERRGRQERKQRWNRKQRDQALLKRQFHLNAAVLNQAGKVHLQSFLVGIPKRCVWLTSCGWRPRMLPRILTTKNYLAPNMNGKNELQVEVMLPLPNRVDSIDTEKPWAKWSNYH